MNSKEALDEMFDLLNYEQTEICGDRNLYRIIAKDLDRLEQLEKENSYLKLLYSNMINYITKFNDRIIDLIQDFNNKECEENETNN